MFSLKIWYVKIEKNIFNPSHAKPNQITRRNLDIVKHGYVYLVINIVPSIVLIFDSQKKRKKKRKSIVLIFHLKKRVISR